MAMIVATAEEASASTMQWVQQFPTENPPDAVMAYDAATNQLVAFGNTSDDQAETWVWDGSQWILQTPLHSPAARIGESLAYDAGTQQLILFGGQTVYTGICLTCFSDVQNDTWDWTGSDWVQLSPVGGNLPQPRTGAQLAYDPATDQLLLFGGLLPEDAACQFLHDTWMWIGTAWIQLSPTSVPLARTYGGFAYDPATGQMLLAGGQGCGENFGLDTASWNGHDWVGLSPATTPKDGNGTGYSGVQMVYDPDTQQMLFWGGVNNQNTNTDTWNWDGTTFSAIGSVPDRITDSNEAAYDAQTHQLVDLNLNTETTWVWTPVTDSTPPSVSITASPPSITNATTATVAFNVTDPDDATGSISVACSLDGAAAMPCTSPVSYTSIGEGSHSVLVIATDPAGNTTSSTVNWTVDTSPPLMSITATPPAVTNKTNASFAFTALDPDSDAAAATLATSCSLDGAASACASPVSYTGLADGYHSFDVTATDLAGNSGTDSFTWLVDTVPPVLSLPQNINVDATGPNGAVVTYTATASDPDDRMTPAPVVTCVPPSGTTFAIRTTTVTCQTTDTAGNTAQGTFTVTVKGATQQIGDITNIVQQITVLGNSLNSKLQAAIAYIKAGNIPQACASLASFISQVQAQSGKQITTAQANTLIADATQIQSVLGC
jgi:hypothetical protein